PRLFDGLREVLRAEGKTKQGAHGSELGIAQQCLCRRVFTVRPSAKFTRLRVRRLEQLGEKGSAETIAAGLGAHDEIHLTIANNADRVGARGLGTSGLGTARIGAL